MEKSRNPYLVPIDHSGGTNDPRTDLEIPGSNYSTPFVEHWVLRILRRPEFGIAATLP